MLLLGASAFVLSGCGGLGLGPTDANSTIYVLEPALQPAPAGGVHPGILSGKLDPDAIVPLEGKAA